MNEEIVFYIFSMLVWQIFLLKNSQHFQCSLQPAKRKKIIKMLPSLSQNKLH